MSSQVAVYLIFDLWTCDRSENVWYPAACARPRLFPWQQGFCSATWEREECAGMLYSSPAHIHMMHKNGNSNHNSTKIHMYALHKNKNILFMRKKENSNLYSLKTTYVTMLNAILPLPNYFPFLLRLLICISSSLSHTLSSIYLKQIYFLSFFL